jgi:hypothetical protein
MNQHGKERKVDRMKRTIRGMLVIVGLLAGGLVVLGAGGWRWDTASGASSPELSSSATSAVLNALVGPEGEYAAYATYAAILVEYGEVQPYARILESEARHIEALQRTLDRYGVEYPTTNPYLGVIDAPTSLAVAAQAGVSAEQANVALYAEELAAVSAYPDVVRVFTNLQAASLESHLPAFEQALENGGNL